MSQEKRIDDLNAWAARMENKIDQVLAEKADREEVQQLDSRIRATEKTAHTAGVMATVSLSLAPIIIAAAALLLHFGRTFGWWK